MTQVQAKLTDIVTKDNGIVYTFEVGLKKRQHFVIHHPTRGMLVVTIYRERAKVIDYLVGRRTNLDDVMGVPALEYESAYDNIPDTKAIQVINRVINLHNFNY